jgi:hypothetical protein
VVTKCVEIGWEAKYVTWKADDDMHKAAQAQAQAKEKEGELSQGPGLSQVYLSRTRTPRLELEPLHSLPLLSPSSYPSPRPTFFTNTLETYSLTD